MKKFNNLSKDGEEKAIRRGFSVPPGAVNIAWAKSPSLSPKNNTIIIDTSRVSGENSSVSTKAQKLAFANYMGVLEDEKGNQLWDEEYPTISDIFLPSANQAKYGDNLVEDDILPYMHVSRFFHVDFVGLANSGFQEYKEAGIKVVDKNGTHYASSNGNKKYKIYLTAQEADYVSGSRDSVYRVSCFLDMNPGVDELYLEYNKVEVTSTGVIRNQQINYRELINPRSQFAYTPEESDVLDYVSSNEKIYSTKPVNLKQKALNLPQSDHQGWKVHVPRKAIADPRIFQLFRWKIACEFVQPSGPQSAIAGEFTAAATIKAGIIVPPNGNHLNTRANYFFHQLNTSDYNFSKTRFINPLKTTNGSYTDTAGEEAAYWHVDIGSVSLADLEKFDILIWAPTTQTLDIAAYKTKIDHFVEQVGGTFIFETSSYVGNGTGLGNFVFSERIDNPSGPTKANSVDSQYVRFYDETPAIIDDEFSSLSGWEQWPPDVKDIVTNYQDMGSLLADAGPIAGWNLTTAEKTGVTPYDEVPNTRFQSIMSWPNGFKKVLESKYNAGAGTYNPVLMVKRYNSGGNFFVSTACIFEDHLFEPSGDLIMRTMQVANWNLLNNNWKLLWDPITSSFAAAAEFKLRYNVAILSTMFRPPSREVNELQNGVDYRSDNQSVTVYSDWESSWVINPAFGVLSETELNEFDFILQSTAPTDLEPTWQRVLAKKTAGQIIDAKLAKINEDDPGFSSKLASAKKRYFIVTTNPTVQVPTGDLIGDESIIRAWTTAYSPPFVVPYYRGAYQVRDEMIAGTGVGEGRRVYPPKSWAVQPKLTYAKSAQETTEATTRVKMTVTTKHNLQVKDGLSWRKVWVPGVNTSSTRMIDDILYWTTAGTGPAEMGQSQRLHQQNVQVPVHYEIDTMTDANYAPRSANWPYWGRSNTISRNYPNGRRSDQQDVLGVQQFLNQLVFFGMLAGPRVPEDGYYGTATYNKIWAYQNALHAQYVDGIIDAETWSLIGYGIMFLSTIPTWRANQGGSLMGIWADQANTSMQLRHVSDSSEVSSYSRASWYTNGPSEIAQPFRVALNPAHPYAVNGLFDVTSVQIRPLGTGWISYLDTNDKGLADFNYGGWPGTVNTGVVNDAWITLPISAKLRSVNFILHSNQSVMWNGSPLGNARMLGIKDMRFLVKRPVSETIVTPGYWQDEQYDPGTFTTVEVTKTFPMEFGLTLKAGQVSTTPAITAYGNWQNALPAAQLSSATLKSITFDAGSLQFIPNSNMASFCDVSFPSTTAAGGVSSNSLNVTFNGYGLTTSPSSYTQGPWYGKGAVQFYTKTEDGAINPYAQRYGWVSKDEGTKLLCGPTGQPVGFPVSLPNLANDNIHFVNYALEVDDTDQTTYLGFWDNVRKEWITNSSGQPVMSYYEYVRRGTQNVYIAVRTSYELDTEGDLPNPLAPVKRPFKWAMPVYGVTTGGDSKIQLLPLNPDLSPTDIWPVKIKTGTFSRTVDLKPRANAAYTGWINDYQGSKVYAYYSIPEAQDGPWSKLFGRPYTDVENEQPLILDDDVIQVRQYPILLFQEPTTDPTLSDPWRAIFTVSIRQTLSSPWVEVPMTDIKDYDVTKGVIILKKNLPSNDPRLVKVTYTSEGNSYNLKWDGTNRINLNPYINPNKSWVDRPLYVYMVPEYVLDKDYKKIPGTSQSRTIRVTTDSSIFSPLQADYEPLSVMLGVVYITTSFDIDDLSILDTRRRGGGVSTSYTDESAMRLSSDVENFWDIGSLTATSYQKGGFVVIRFPEEIAQYCTKRQIEAVIDRNITLGVGYKLETLDGRELELMDELGPDGEEV